MMKKYTLLLAIMIATSAQGWVDQSALPGVLHTDAAERMDPLGTNVAFHTWWMFDNDDYFQHDRIITPSDTFRVNNLLAVNNYLAFALGLPGGVGLSITLPMYYEQVDFAGNSHAGNYLGDALLKAVWVLPRFHPVPWLSELAGAGVNLPTSSTGQGYVVREMEYAYADQGCYLYSCGSRNTGLQFTNLEFRLGATADLNKASVNKSVKIHANLFYRLTGMFEPGVGPYQVKDDDVYDVEGLSLAGELFVRKNLFVFAEYRHEKRRHSDYSWMADLHQLSYGLLWDAGHGVGILGGVAQGIFNDRYAKGMYVTSTGEHVANYGFKTPDLQVFAGVTWAIGKDRDDDGDGVINAKDACPATPKGATVDIEGCAPRDVRDQDHDGVPDIDDQCPNTAEGIKVDRKGCALDSDQDGVPDSKDECPATPKGVSVDATGCAKDADGDGVVNKLDECPNTLKSVRVDNHGCPIQETQDLAKLQRQINFEVGSANLKKESLPVLDNLAQLLIEIPDVGIEIQGHTDKDGSAKFNQDLSQRRAQAVVDYLVKKGIASERLRAKGYGYSLPIADNRTLEGKRRNRRVELIPIQ